PAFADSGPRKGAVSGASHGGQFSVRGRRREIAEEAGTRGCAQCRRRDVAPPRLNVYATNSVSFRQFAILADVISNGLQGILTSDNPIMKTGLPAKLEIVRPAPIRDCGLKGPDYGA